MAVKQLDNVKPPEVDGAIDLIFGEFGGGKNVLAYKIAIEALERGIPVYCSFPMTFNGVNESNSWFYLVLGVLGLKRVFRVIDASNFHHVSMKEIMSDTFVEHLADLVECVVIVDEAYAARLFDSYRKTNLSVEARMAVYATRHFDRRFVIVAQRPNAVHVSSRAMVNRFYRCMQPLRFTWYLFRFRMFIITEFQEMIDESVDLETPYRTRVYFAGKRMLSGFDSKYMRGGRVNKYPSKYYKFKFGYMDIWKEIFIKLNYKRKKKSLEQGVATLVATPTLPHTRSIRDIDTSRT